MPKKTFNLKYLAPEAPENIFDWLKAQKKIWPNLLKGVCVGPGVGGVCGTPPPPPEWC